MLSPETVERYRRMTPAERFELTLEAIREATPYLLMGPPEIVDRRFERIRQQNELGNRRMLERLAAATERMNEGA